MIHRSVHQAAVAHPVLAKGADLTRRPLKMHGPEPASRGQGCLNPPVGDRGVYQNRPVRYLLALELQEMSESDSVYYHCSQVVLTRPPSDCGNTLPTQQFSIFS